MKTRTVQTYIQRAILQHATVGFAVLIVVALTVSLLLAREQAATDLLESAKATGQAFHDRILEGDIRSVEPQISQVLQLKSGEVAKVLNSDKEKIYTPIIDLLQIEHCPAIGVVCFNGFFGKAKVEYPIYSGSTDAAPFGYIYLTRSIPINWSFLATVFTVFALGYAGLIFGFFRIAKVASLKLGKEINVWSERIKDNPKDASPRATVPFAEMEPLKQALEGLNDQILRFEREATDRTRLLVLRGIAHDILTPVSQLQLNLATLEAQIPSGQYQELLGDIRDSLKRVTGIASQVKTLKDVSTHETSEIVSLAEAEVRALAESSICSEKDIQLKFSADSKAMVSPFSKTDVSRLVSNLVQNAVDASPVGSTIRVSLSSQSGNGKLSIADDGKGIAKSDQSRVFDPEFTLKPGTGTGLGLAVVKYICDKRSANINLQSELNKGTTVSIQFPIVRGDACTSY